MKKTFSPPYNKCTNLKISKQSNIQVQMNFYVNLALIVSSMIKQEELEYFLQYHPNFRYM